MKPSTELPFVEESKTSLQSVYDPLLIRKRSCSHKQSSPVQQIIDRKFVYNLLLQVSNASSFGSPFSAWLPNSFRN